MSELRTKLDEAIPSDAIQTKPGKGSLSYVRGGWVTDRANQVFGHDGWSCETRSIRFLHGGEPLKVKDKAIVLAEATVRVTHLASGAFREGTAVGTGEMSDPRSAFHNAVGEAETDARKRALACFGRHLGGQLYLGKEDARSKPGPAEGQSRANDAARAAAVQAAKDALDVLEAATSRREAAMAWSDVGKVWGLLDDELKERLTKARDKAKARIGREGRAA